MARRYQPRSRHSANAGPPILENAENKAMLDLFRQYGKELDDKHDRYERIVKISRDITIESKRIIFLLHNVDKNQSKRSDLLAEADHRLSNQINTNFSVIAWELQHVDQYQYIRAFSAGLQEFIEAYTYFNYVRDESIVSRSNLQLRLTYQQGVNKKNDKAVELPVLPPFTCLIDQTEFLLGIGDLTGEVMRRSIFALGIGDFETCFAACRFLRSVYSCFIGIQTLGKPLNSKLGTLRQSLQKAEMVCFNIKVRGREAIRTSLAPSEPTETDEGFSNN